MTPAFHPELQPQGTQVHSEPRTRAALAGQGRAGEGCGMRPGALKVGHLSISERSSLRHGYRLAALFT